MEEPRHVCQESRQSWTASEADGDKYGTLDIYQADVEYLESIEGQPLPDSPQDRIAILRKIWGSGGEGIGNILDIRSVTDEGGVFVTRRLPAEEVRRYLATARPSKADAKKLLGVIADRRLTSARSKGAAAAWAVLSPMPTPHSGVCRRYPDVEAELKRSGIPEVREKLRELTGCSEAWAKLWMIHPDGPQEADPPPKRCPYCGNLLKTGRAQQCLACGADWHNKTPNTA